MIDGRDRLIAIAGRLKEGATVDTVTVREFLSWFNAQRRGIWVVAEIQSQLQSSGLMTAPDFESTYIDGHIAFQLVDTSQAHATSAITGSSNVTDGADTLEARGTVVASATATASAAASYADRPDPTHSISKLLAANKGPISVSPDAPLQEAITLMLARGYSQLPVMTSIREVKGVVSWQSIGARLGTGQTGVAVREMMEAAHEVPDNISIFQVIPMIVANDYVLVRRPDKVISGIVTASDLSLQFQQLSEPFLLLSEIENQLRQRITDRFAPAMLAECRDPLDTSRPVSRASDLNFGEYIRLLESPERWQDFAPHLDRHVFCMQLGHVRDIRNDVMHFDPDGISPESLDTLREFARFFQRLTSIGIT